MNNKYNKRIFVKELCDNFLIKTIDLIHTNVCDLKGYYQNVGANNFIDNNIKYFMYIMEKKMNLLLEKYVLYKEK